MERKIEILAPAGSYEGMKAAMNAGCDAVYIGGSSFGARAFANNPEEDTLLRAIDEAHIRGKKLYLTVNTLLKEKELTGELYSFLNKYYLQGLDAVIVQDVGVLHFIHEHFPELPIHASTQMTLTMAQGANLLENYGVTRLVTSRELSLKEIRTIRENTTLEIETFVHGALCYCYSGQCLMSSIIGGRSGNRGRCAQPCRMPYQFYLEGSKQSKDQDKYLLSPKDINTLTILPELIEAGVDSFKIEGRMKRPEYAAAVAYAYRKYADLYLREGKAEYQKFLNSNEFKKDMLILQDVYNRGGFSEGYSKTYHGKGMMSLSRPNHSGVLVGEVREVKGSQVGILVKESVNAQDILEIRHNEEDGYEFTVKDAHHPGDILWTNVGKRPDYVAKETRSQNATTTRTGYSVKNNRSQEDKGNKTTNVSVKLGATVYRTKNNALLEYLEQEYLVKDKKLGIKGLLKAKLGERLALTVAIGNVTITAYQDIVQEALKQPMTKEKLTAPIEKTGDTLYYFEALQIEADDNIFVPVAWLNEIRREAVGLLQEAVASGYRRRVAQVTEVRREDEWNTETSVMAGIVVSIHTREQYETAMEVAEIKAIYADYDAFSLEEIQLMAAAAYRDEKEFYLSLPLICRQAVYERLKTDILEIIERDDIRGFLVKNFEEIALLLSLLPEGNRGKEIILNYNMYTYNKEAKAFWRERGLTHFTAPVELNYQELKNLGVEDSDLLVYGYLPLMVSAQCLFENTQGCRKRGNAEANQKNIVGYSGNLVDRLGKSFYVQTNCNACYNIIYNGQALALHKQSEEVLRLKPRNIRLDFTKETKNEMKQILKIFVDGYRYNKKSVDELNDYTTGHFKRGVE